MKSEEKKTAEELRRDIERTRSQMTQTVGAIEQQLPQTIKAKAEETIGEVKHMAADAVDQAKHAAVEQYQEAKAAVKQEVSEQVREARYAVRRATIGRVENMVHRAGDSVNDAGNSIVDTIKANPIPAALVGIGLAWLFMGKSSRRNDVRVRSDRYGYGYEGGYEPGYQMYGHEDEHDGLIDRGRDAVRGGVRRVRGVASDGMHEASAMAHDVRDRVQGAASSARHAAGDFIEHTGERAHAIADYTSEHAHALALRAQRGAMRAERGAERIFEENPLAVGAAAIAVGAMIGLAIPHTDREDALMGSARDKLVQKGEEMATGAMEKASEVAKDKLKSNGDRTSVS